ncbi:MAG: hypothetical protein AABX28_03305 [Nanoarchaeota archaeon]
MNKKIRNVGALTGLALAVTLSGCGSLKNFTNDVSRNISPREYHLTLYAADGSKILDKGIYTYINIHENGSGLRYLEHGKLVMINGTYTLEER